LSSKFLSHQQILKPMAVVFEPEYLPNSLFLIDPYKHLLI